MQEMILHLMHLVFWGAVIAFYYKIASGDYKSSYKPRNDHK